MSCLSCLNPSDEKYLIYCTKNFKIVLDETCQLFPGKYLIVAKNHSHPNDIYGDILLFREIQQIKIQMENAIRIAFGSGDKYHREIRFNYCRLGNSFKDPKDEHYHEYGIPTSPALLKVIIKGYEYTFSYHIFGKPFDNTIRSRTPSLILEWILSQIKDNLNTSSVNIAELKLQYLSSISSEDCKSCTPILYEMAPLFESNFFKVVLNDANQWCFGRLHIVSKYHLDIDLIKYYDEIIDEFWEILQLIHKLIYKFYDDEEGCTTRIHICQLNNMTGQIGNSHAHFHVIPRSKKSLTINGFEMKDEFWGQSFNNNIRYKPSSELLNSIRIKYLELLKSFTCKSIKIIDIFNPNPLEISRLKGCFQCDNVDKDKDIMLFKTNNFRCVLRADDQRVFGRSLIISLNHTHPEEFKKNIDLVIEQNLIEVILHETFKKCYGYKRGQYLRLGNLTTDPKMEHAHEHYIPSTDEDIILSLETGEKIVIKDERWNKATNINPAEGYMKVKRSEEIMNMIIKHFRNNLIDIYQMKNEIITTLRNKGLDILLVSNMESIVSNIIDSMQIVFD